MLESDSLRKISEGEQPKFARCGMLERDKHDKIDYHVIWFVDLDVIPQESIQIIIYVSLNGFISNIILKPMTDEIKVNNRNKLISYIYHNNNFIKEVSFNDSLKALIKKIKTSKLMKKFHWTT